MMFARHLDFAFTHEARVPFDDTQALARALESRRHAVSPLLDDGVLARNDG